MLLDLSFIDTSRDTGLTEQQPFLGSPMDSGLAKVIDRFHRTTLTQNLTVIHLLTLKYIQLL